MSVTHLNFDWPFYFSMLALVTLWNCGATAITRKGKIGYFILQYFERTKLVQEKFGHVACRNLDLELRAYLSRHAAERQEEVEEVRVEMVAGYMDENKLYSEMTPLAVLRNLDSYIPNSYYHLAERRILSHYLTDPIITCITCMASFHSLVLYTLVILFKGYNWNPFEWVAVAIPCAFLGEFLWKLKCKLEDE